MQSQGQDKFKATSASLTTNAEASLVTAPTNTNVAHHITSISVSNMHATQGTRILVLDGAGGATIWQGPAAALGGGFNAAFGIEDPLVLTGGKAVVVKCETAGAEVMVSVKGFTKYTKRI